jgi:hypothetical protein
MSKRRTKEQKIKAQYRYTAPRQFTVSHADTVTPAVIVSPTKQTNDVLSLYSYDPAYIRQDIRKTVIISGFILALQLGLYFWLK